MAPVDVLIGLDIGTTCAKAVLYSPSGAELASAECACTLSTPQLGWVEQDPQDVWEAIACSLRELARSRGGFRHVAKLEFGGAKPQMLVAFLERADESPERIDPRLAGQQVIDLEQFAPICDMAKR